MERVTKQIEQSLHAARLADGMTAEEEEMLNASMFRLSAVRAEMIVYEMQCGDSGAQPSYEGFKQFMQRVEDGALDFRTNFKKYRGKK